jgi:hypothetical protein
MTINKIREWFDSEEGKQSIKKYFEKEKQQELIYQSQIERLEAKLTTELIDKIYTKYESDKYYNREMFKCSRFPNNTLYWMLWDIAKQRGIEADEEYLNDFSENAFILEDYVIMVIHGQGSVVQLFKINK